MLVRCADTAAGGDTMLSSVSSYTRMILCIAFKASESAVTASEVCWIVVSTADVPDCRLVALYVANALAYALFADSYFDFMCVLRAVPEESLWNEFILPP